jgi:hypothetical protein
MKTHETTTPVRAFDRAYINGQFVTPHGTQIVDLVNPTDNKVIGKVAMADEIDTRKAIGAAKQAFNTFSQSSKDTGWSCCSGCTTPWPKEWINSLKPRSWNRARRKTVRRAPTVSRRTFSCTSRKSSKISSWSRLSAPLKS